MNVRPLTTLAIFAALGAPLAAAADAPPAANGGNGANAVPVWVAFKKANDAIKDYTETLTSHEVSGTKTEDRVYHFAFAKPALARSAIISGPGRGGEAVWHGGDTIRGHQGGFLSGIKLTLSIHDGRATDIRGKTIDTAFYPTMIATMEGNGGKMTGEPGPLVDGAPTDEVVLTPADPSLDRGLTKDVLIFSQTTHLPVKHLGYEGTQIVEDDTFTDIKVNPDLPAGTFDM